MEKNIWRTDWIRPFESPWSILEKFCFSNVIKRRGQLLKHLGNEKVKKIKGQINAQKHINLLTMQGFDGVSLINSIGENLILQNNENLNKIINNLQRISSNPIDWFNKDLNWCEKCMKDGYHSILHQFKLLKHCPFHMRELKQTCTNCNSIIPYQISDTALSDAYTCKCGFQLADLQNRWVNWSKRVEIACEYTKRWLDTNYNYENQSVIFLPEHAIVQKNPIKTIVELLEDAESHITYGGNGKSLSSHLKSPLTISQFSIDNQKCFHDYYIDHDFTITTYKRENMSFFKYMYRQSVNVFKSIESHLLNGELSKHKSCIKRLRELRKEERGEYPEICPFAYAYVFWKHSIIADKYFFSDDLIVDVSKTIHGFELLSGFFQPDLFEFIKLLIGKNNHKKKMQMGLFKWIIMKFVAVNYLHNFYSWKKLASEGAAKKMVPNYNELVRNRHLDIPMMIFKLPYPSSNSFKDSKNTSFIVKDHKDTMSTIDLICPFNSNKKRIIKPTEISHHPMTLAMNKNLSSHKSITESYVKNLDIFRMS
ncbi:hypothetical protein [Paenibacillus sp. P36]|uniref:hypothetical protein n=1 Tax=Paenibacillus sp. P36 TaxID=3342538 RepID=UPI0038B2824A